MFGKFGRIVIIILTLAVSAALLIFTPPAAVDTDISNSKTIIK